MKCSLKNVIMHNLDLDKLGGGGEGYFLTLFDKELRTAFT